MKKFVIRKIKATNSKLLYLKSKIVGKSEYGEWWQEKDKAWYNRTFKEFEPLHQKFIDFVLSNKSSIKTVLEIGCGTGTYPILNKSIFLDISYTGIDFNKSAIQYCKNNSNFEFICGDLLKLDFPKKFDLVFAHAVVDHVYDIDAFIKKMIDLSNNFVYIHTYREFFPDILTHKMRWVEEHTAYVNDLSIPQIRKLILNNGIKSTDFKVIDNKIIQIFHPKSMN